MNVLEIDESINDIKKALGFCVQNVYYADKTLVLKLWQNHIIYWLVLSVNLGQQGLVLLDSELFLKIKNEKKPLGNFTDVHLKGGFFVGIWRDENVGRKVILEFVTLTDQEFKIDLSLVPSSLNMSVSLEKKIVHLFKPKELPDKPEVDLSAMVVRPLESLRKVYLNKFKSLNSKESKYEKPKKSLQDEIAKKKKAIERIKKDFKNQKGESYLEFAKLLEIDKKRAKADFPEFFDDRKNIFKLKDEYYAKYKNFLTKKTRVQKRILNLQDEIKFLENTSESDWLAKQKSRSLSEVKFTSEIKTRKLNLAEDLAAYYGKSASDNLKLLRSAKAWHYWFHLKDLPSSHMILFRDKSRVVSEDEIKKLCEWFVFELNAKNKDLSNAYFEILMVECRYVRPIKGDKLGRVHYSNEKVFRFKL